jgi:peptide-methionine (S)-S-oxide reductase
MKRIVLGGGCFWGVEAYFKKLKGIGETTSGYANGNIKNPRYEDLKYKRATHVEAVEIYYDNKIIDLNKILEHLFRIIDPTSRNAQGGDVGIQYRTGVYFKDEADRKIIEAYIKNEQKKYSKKIVVEILQEYEFYNAEDYHQDYLDKNPKGYCHVNMNLIKANEKK